MRALIFDFDGLILDTETTEFRVWTEVFASHGLEMPGGYWAQLIGRGAEEEFEGPDLLLCRMLGQEAYDPTERAAISARILERLALEKVRPGVLELLLECRAEGLPLAVASSSKHEWVDGWLVRHQLIDFFAAVVCKEDAPRAKPAPDLFLLACARLSVLPSEALALEDSPNGVRAAREAGVFVVAVPNSVTRELDLSEADAVLETLDGVKVGDLRGMLGDRKR